jgi:RNA polymerase sigma-54 factor
MGLSLVQRQSLKQKMAPALYQSVKLLQLNNDQLVDFLAQKALENPLLHTDSVRSPGVASGSMQWSDDSRSTTDVIEETIASSEDFREELRHQLHQLTLEKIPMAAANFLIDNLNEKGYFDEDPEELLKGYGLEPGVAAAALNAVQSLDPVGIGARSLTECLLLQLKRMVPEPFLAESILSDYPDCFTSGDWDGLAAELKTSAEKISNAVDTIRNLNPVPVTTIQTDESQYIVPDITIIKSDIGLRCELEDRDLPTISLDSLNYINYMAAADNKTKRYLREKKAEADWLISGISRRKQTLVHLTERLMTEQADYLETGNRDALRPFPMKKAAEQLSLSESTVSRAVANKYVQTPYGLIPMKKLFVRAVRPAQGTVSSFQILSRIRHWISVEDTGRPFSDEQLVRLLAGEGLHCSRRAVAKYRLNSGIGSTAERRTR